MGLLTVTLELYFAATLGVAGLSKVDTSSSFAMTLRQQRILPSWSIGFVSRILPWGEILLAVLLLVGIKETITVIAVTLLFAVFLGIKVFLFITKSEADCGCTAHSQPQKVDGVSVAVSVLLLFFAILLLWFVTRETSVNWIWRLPVALLFIGVGCVLFGRIILRHHRYPLSLANSSQAPNIGLPVGVQAPSFTATDQYRNQIKLDDFRGKRCILAFVATWCSACPGALKALSEFLIDEPRMAVLIVTGSNDEVNQRYVLEHDITLPFLTADPDLVEQVYHIQSFPIVFALDETGIIRAKSVVNNTSHLHTLIENAYPDTYSMQV